MKVNHKCILQTKKLLTLLQYPVWLSDDLYLFQDLSPHWNDAIAHHLKLFGGDHTQVQDATLGVWPPVIDTHDHALLVAKVGYPNHRIERQVFMSGG